MGTGHDFIGTPCLRHLGPHKVYLNSFPNMALLQSLRHIFICDVNIQTIGEHQYFIHGLC